MAGDGGTKAVVAALLANTGIAITKFIAFFLTGLSSMLAEAIHSVADAGNQVLLLVGGKRSRREATEEHPFGYGRERYIYAFIVSIVLFSVGGLFALYEAYHKFHEIKSGHHEDAGKWWWVPLAVLGMSIVLESFSFRTAIIETNKVKGDASYQRFVRRAKQPELPVILLEDLAALLGLIFALFAVSLSLITDNYYFDVAGTAMIGLLLVVVAIVLAIETKSLLLGEAATPDAQQRIEAALRRDSRCRAHHPHEDPPPRTGGAARGCQDRGQRLRHGRPGRRDHRRGRGSCPSCGTAGHRDLSRARHRALRAPEADVQRLGTRPFSGESC